MLKYLKVASYILVLIGALNWGLVGLLDFDLVATLFGEMSSASKAVYILVGLSALISPMTVYMDRS